MQHTVYLFDGFQLDVTRRKLVSSGGLVQPLNSRAMDALLLLVANAGELVEKRRLMQTVWPNAIVEDNNLNQCILAIRKALGETAGSNRYIMTVQGRGYRFVSPVREVAQESLAETGKQSTLHQRPARMVLAGISGAACLLLLAILWWRISLEHSPRSVAVKIIDEADRAAPTLVVRFGEPVAAGTARDPGGLLAQCLAARPELKLRVRVELLDGREEIWAGSYAADFSEPDDLPGGSDGSTGCSDLRSSAH